MFSDSCTSVLEERSLQYFRNFTTRGGRNCLRRDEHCATVCPLDEQDNNNLWIKLPGRDGPHECMLARKREAERKGNMDSYEEIITFDIGGAVQRCFLECLVR